MAGKKKTTDAIEIMRKEFGDDPQRCRRVENCELNMHIAQIPCDARKDARLTQRQLAELIGTRPQVIARLEDADYEGHSLSMLRRIGEALSLHLESAS